VKNAETETNLKNGPSLRMDRAVYQSYQELREQLRQDPNLPEPYDAVTELENVTQRLPEASPLHLLALKEVARCSNG
jgi:hypothetical protein